MKKTIACLLVIITMIGCKSESKDLAINDELVIYDFEGLEPLLNNKDGNTYVINFWATWCAPCIKELPYFEELNQNYAGKNVEVILVSLDFPQQYEKKLIPYIKEKNLKSQVVALNDTDMNSWIPKISESWTGAIPATLIYNSKRRAFYERTFSYDELVMELRKFIEN
ncbi:MAG: TlpA family protein disulfide reductase [Flavobacteriaceae bacterium]|nr:TlpA family protein disulfide reductase [Flavobacteriaceae bacterium]